MKTMATSPPSHQIPRKQETFNCLGCLTYVAKRHNYLHMNPIFSVVRATRFKQKAMYAQNN